MADCLSGRRAISDPDLAAVLEEPDGVDGRDLLVHVLAATIEDPAWPAVLAQVPPAAFYRMCAWVPLSRLGMITSTIH